MLRYSVVSGVLGWVITSIRRVSVSLKTVVIFLTCYDCLIEAFYPAKLFVSV